MVRPEQAARPHRTASSWTVGPNLVHRLWLPRPQTNTLPTRATDDGADGAVAADAFDGDADSAGQLLARRTDFEGLRLRLPLLHCPPLSVPATVEVNERTAVEATVSPFPRRPPPVPCVCELSVVPFAVGSRPS